MLYAKRFSIVICISILFITGLAGSLSAATKTIKPYASVIKLNEIGWYNAGYVYRNGRAYEFPFGWTGPYDDASGVWCSTAGKHKGRDAFLIHCPWRGGTGTAYQDFSFELPKTTQIRLKGAIALRKNYESKSDGATFRIYVNNTKLFDENYNSEEWKTFDLDLTSYAGKTADIRFETDPGPADDCGWDYSVWGDRQLILEGFKSAPEKRPAPLPINISFLNSTLDKSTISKTPYWFRKEIVLKNNTATLKYLGADGNIEYTWQLPKADGPGFGKITVKSQMQNDQAYEIPLAESAGFEWCKPAKALDSKWEKGRDSITCVRSFDVGGTIAKVKITGTLVSKNLVFDVTCSSALISTLNPGAWGPVLCRRQIPVPYYGTIDYLPAENLFTNTRLDWTASSASYQEANHAYYKPLTDGTRNTLKERIIYSPSWHLAEVLPGIPNKPSPYLNQLGKRIVLDIWGGKFTEIASGLERLYSYGIRDCTAIVHIWQRSGYDNALPAHIPANINLGGNDDMKTLADTAKKLRYLLALHENYVDYYPNYDRFNEKQVSLDSDGKKQTSWFNPSTKIQSFAIKPNAILPLAKSQSPEIHRLFETTACYLDVHSAVQPWFHPDQRAGELGAGRYSQVYDTYAKLWQFERNTHKGPVFGEGNNHWYWSGLLDGVEAQFGTGQPVNSGLDAPLMVDFDLLKIHPLQVNHGMGYYERWHDNPNWARIMPMVVLDQYRMQQIAYGHAAFLGAGTWDFMPAAWQEYNLAVPVAERYGSALPISIRYQIDGVWADSTAAAKAGNWDRVQIKYNNGLKITANNSKKPMSAGKYLLPQFGWVAEGPEFTAWTALKDGVVADYVKTPASYFANARNTAHWDFTSTGTAKPSISEFIKTGDRKFTVTYQWQVFREFDTKYRCFVHFEKHNTENPETDIPFQQDHDLRVPTSFWQPGVNIKDGPYTVELKQDLPDGDYDWYIGLYDSNSSRPLLRGNSDSKKRIILGVLHIRDNGSRITFKPDNSSAVKIYKEHTNATGKAVDFGPIYTNGSVSITREGSDWVMRTMPRDKSFILKLNSAQFGKPKTIKCTGSQTTEISPQFDGKWWSISLNGASQYRWRAY